MSGFADTDNYWDQHREPSDEDVDELCRAWLRYQARHRPLPAPEGVERSWRVVPARLDEPEDNDPDLWAVDAICELDGEPLELQWRVIRRLCECAEGGDEHAIAMIGCAPVESFLFHEGEQAMDLIEPAADEVPALLATLENVWMWDQPFSPRLDRYLAAKGRSRR